MSSNSDPTTVRAPSRGQRLFLVYTLFILVDLAVLNFFDELIPFIVVVVTIILTEALLSKVYTMLGDEPASD